jgi:hypothetical protein
MPKIALPLVACLLAIAATGASAQSVWKWRDAAGQIHLSDTPPPNDTPAGNVLQRPNGGRMPVAASASAVAAAPAASAPDTDLQKKKKQADREVAEKAAADKAALDQKNAEIRRDNCQRAQTQVSALQNGARVARLNAKGEREFLDDAARAAEIKRTQDIAAQNCGTAPASPR